MKGRGITLQYDHLFVNKVRKTSRNSLILDNCKIIQTFCGFFLCYPSLWTLMCSSSSTVNLWSEIFAACAVIISAFFLYFLVSYIALFIIWCAAIIYIQMTKSPNYSWAYSSQKLFVIPKVFIYCSCLLLLSLVDESLKQTFSSLPWEQRLKLLLSLIL